MEASRRSREGFRPRDFGTELEFQTRELP